MKSEMLDASTIENPKTAQKEEQSSTKKREQKAKAKGKDESKITQVKEVQSRRGKK
jgi:hypothetical protein